MPQLIKRKAKPKPKTKAQKDKERRAKAAKLGGILEKVSKKMAPQGAKAKTGPGSRNPYSMDMGSGQASGMHSVAKSMLSASEARAAKAEAKRKARRITKARG